MMCLASIGALSLARMAANALRTWCHGRRIYEGPIENEQDEARDARAAGPRVRSAVHGGETQPEQPQHEEDQEKVKHAVANHSPGGSCG